MGGRVMDEYIKREAFRQLLVDRQITTNFFDNTKRNEDGCIIDLLDKFSAADVAPVRHGRWIERKSFHADGGVSAKCSVCKNDVQYLGNPLNYCPNCGAKMDGGDNGAAD